MSSAEHWEAIYREKADTDLSWFQADPDLSVRLILEASAGRGRVIDVGGGTSLLVERLLGRPFNRIAVLDISAAALERSKQRLGQDAAAKVEWVAADVTSVERIGEFDVWHDRAVFHFLTAPPDREKYL
jgi:trans-aconitate methyltransferase